MANTPVRRCAIYTRKSSEEGLEQDYNSLHAQREACEAFSPRTNQRLPSLNW
jgi:site-specific DNA recombinase